MRPRVLPLLFSVSALAVSACGSDAAKQAATATKGDAFCVAAEKVNTDSNRLGGVIVAGKPDEVKAAYATLLAESNAALKVAPKDIEATLAATVKVQQQIADALEKAGWDVIGAAADPDVKALFDSASATGEKIDAYISTKCDIDTNATGGVGDGTIANLSDTEALDKLVDLYAISVGKQVTDDQRACLHKELDGKFTSESLNVVLTGGEMPANEQQDLGLAFITCGLA